MRKGSQRNLSALRWALIEWAGDDQVALRERIHV